jgi:polysaccharide pyruvyl transferase WcaK-like protein
MTMKIAHFGTFDVPNFGDLLFPLILERRLADLDVDWVHASPRGGAAVWGDCVSTVSVESLVNDPSNLAALVVGGGNIINGSPTNLPDYDQGGLSAVLAYPRLWLEPAHLAARLDLPLWWNAPGVSEPFSRNAARLARWASSITDHLAVRDRTSEKWLREAGVECDLCVVPDTALEVSLLWSETEMAAAHAEAFARRDCRVPERSIAFHLNERFVREPPEIIAGRLDRICQRARATGILIAMGPCHGDSAMQRAVGGKMVTRPLVIDQPQSLREIVACIARSEAYVGSSLHGAITACAFGRKCMAVVSPGAPTRHKFTGFLEMFQLAPWICDSWEQADERMDGLLPSPADLWQRVPELGRAGG